MPVVVALYPRVLRCPACTDMKGLLCTEPTDVLMMEVNTAFRVSHCRSGSVYERLTNSDSIVHLNYIPIPLPDHVGKEGDFVLLMSARTPHVDGLV